MKSLVVAFVTLLSVNAFAAETLTCTLKSGKSTSSATMKLNSDMDMSEDNDNAYTGEDLDLSLVLMGDCNGNDLSLIHI